MGIKALYEKINGDGFTITYEETRDIFRRYQDEFSTGIKFLRDSGKKAANEGVMVNINGRRRYWIRPNLEDREKYPKGKDDHTAIAHLAAIEREGGNFPIQSVNADITKFAMVKIRDYKKKYGIRTEFVNQVYDEIVTETHIDDSPSFCEIKRKLMIEAAQRWIKKIPIEVEGSVFPYWTK